VGTIMGYVIFGGLYILLYLIMEKLISSVSMKNIIKYSLLALAGLSLTIAQSYTQIYTVALITISIIFYFLTIVANTKDKVDYANFLLAFSIIYILTNDLIVMLFTLFAAESILVLYRINSSTKNALVSYNFLKPLLFKLLIFCLIYFSTITTLGTGKLNELVKADALFFASVVSYLTIISMGFIFRKKEFYDYENKYEITLNSIMRYIVFPSKAIILLGEKSFYYLHNTEVFFTLVGLMVVYYFAVFYLSRERTYTIFKYLEFFTVFSVLIAFLANKDNTSVYFLCLVSVTVPMIYFNYFKGREIKNNHFFIMLLFIFSGCFPLSPGIIMLNSKITELSLNMNEFIVILFRLSLLLPVALTVKLFEPELKAVYNNKTKLNKIAVYCALSIIFFQSYTYLIYE
jgi:hypothetical protein